MATDQSPPQEWVSSSPDQTEAIARQIADRISPGHVVRLSGELGAGKTCFVRGFVSARGDAELVSSPSFTLVQEYPAGQIKIYHWDLYRLSPATDWSVLDLADHLADERAITLVEWPDRYPGPWPDAGRTASIDITIDPHNQDTRHIRLTLL
jgi:tRNA threonylcarbamoyladenosine biosynthesis protein TsaE